MGLGSYYDDLTRDEMLDHVSGFVGPQNSGCDSWSA